MDAETMEYIDKKIGEKNMSGDLGASQAATLALLADTSRAGRGGYFGGGYGEGGGAGIMFPGNSMLAAGAHADGTAVKTSTLR